MPLWNFALKKGHFAQMPANVFGTHSFLQRLAIPACGLPEALSDGQGAIAQER